MDLYILNHCNHYNLNDESIHGEIVEPNEFMGAYFFAVSKEPYGKAIELRFERLHDLLEYSDDLKITYKYALLKNGTIRFILQSTDSNKVFLAHHICGFGNSWCIYFNKKNKIIARQEYKTDSGKKRGKYLYLPQVNDENGGFIDLTNALIYLFQTDKTDTSELAKEISRLSKH